MTSASAGCLNRWRGLMWSIWYSSQGTNHPHHPHRPPSRAYTASRKSAFPDLFSDPPQVSSKENQIPPDLVVKCQGIDNAEVIFQLIWRRTIVQTSCRHRICGVS